jgi:hypothetical protein
MGIRFYMYMKNDVRLCRLSLMRLQSSHSAVCSKGGIEYVKEVTGEDVVVACSRDYSSTRQEKLRKPRKTFGNIACVLARDTNWRLSEYRSKASPLELTCPLLHRLINFPTTLFILEEHKLISDFS